MQEKNIINLELIIKEREEKKKEIAEFYGVNPKDILLQETLGNPNFHIQFRDKYEMYNNEVITVESPVDKTIHFVKVTPELSEEKKESIRQKNSHLINYIEKMKDEMVNNYLKIGLEYEDETEEDYFNSDDEVLPEEKTLLLQDFDNQPTSGITNILEMNEIDLFIEIRKTENILQNKDGEKSVTELVENENRLTLLQAQTTRYGVDLIIPKPGEKIELTEEYHAWYKFFQENFDQKFTSTQKDDYEEKRANNENIEMYTPSTNWSDTISCGENNSKRKIIVN